MWRTMLYSWLGLCAIGYFSAVSALSYCGPGPGLAIFGVLALFAVVPLALGAGTSPTRSDREMMDALRHRLAVAEGERARERSGVAPPPP